MPDCDYRGNLLVSKLWSLGDQSILAVDDFREMRSMMREMCTGLGATDITLCSNGEEALEKLAERPRTIILCDYNLGAGKDGQQVLEEARDRKLINQATLFVMITAENAISQVMGAVEHQPDTYLSKPFTKGELQARIRKLQDKKAVFKDIAKAADRQQSQQAIALCDQQLKAYPRYGFELLRIKADLLIGEGDLEAAEAVFKQVLANRELPWALHGLGRVRVGQQRWAEATEQFRAAIAARDNFMPAYDDLAEALRAQGLESDAQAALADAVERSPKNVRRQQKLGALSLKTGDLEVAQKAFSSAIREGRNSCFGGPGDYGGLAEVHLAREDGDEARKVLGDMKKSYRKAEDEVQLQSALIEGRVFDVLGDEAGRAQAIDAAMQLYDKVPESFDPDAAMKLAELCANDGRKEAVAELMQHAVRCNHDDPDLIRRANEVADKAGLGAEGKALIKEQVRKMIDLNNKGVAMAKQGQLAESVKLFIEAARAMPKNLTINLNSAQVLMLLMKSNGCRPEWLGQTSEYLRRAEAAAPSDARYLRLKQMYQGLRQSSEQAA